MTLSAVLRFELSYQLRRLATWLSIVVLFLFGFVMMWAADADGSGGAALGADGAFFNGVAFLAAMGCVGWFLLAATVAGDSAARDVEVRMHPLTYSAPLSKADWLGGRFLAAFVLNASILLGLQAGLLLSPIVLGPPRPAGDFASYFVGHLTVYFVLSFPAAFAATAIQFAVALRHGRAMASYVASVLLLVASVVATTVVAEVFRQPELARLLDPIGFVSILREAESSTPIDLGTRLIVLEGWILAGRLAWIGVGIGALAIAYRGFRFEHRIARRVWFWNPRRAASANVAAGQPDAGAFRADGRSEAMTVARVDAERRFGFATSAHQTLTLAWTSFRAIASSRIGLTLVGALAFGSALFSTEWMVHMGQIPLLPRAEEVLAFYAPPMSRIGTVWVVIPLLIVFFAGELVARERDAGMNEMVDTAPVPEWALLSGKFLGLALVLATWMAMLMAAAILVQVVLGYSEVDVGVYLTVLFTYQLSDYLLFALLVLVVHVLAGEKHLGHVAALIAYVLVTFAPSHMLGIEHKLLVYGSDLGWSYTPMTGFGPLVGPWLWFTLYWTAWAMLLAVLARLFLTRGTGARLGGRFMTARSRVTRANAGVAAAAVTSIFAVGAFSFYNTNVRNEYSSAPDRVARQAEYERRYGRYEGAPQPELTSIDLQIELYPQRREAGIHGTYRLVNRSLEAIDSIHLATAPGITAGEVTFDQPVARAVVDDELAYRIYSLEEPLQPGEALELRFDARHAPRGFTNDGVDISVVENGTYFTNLAWLPAIGYQPNREVTDAAQRLEHGLPARAAIPSLEETEALQAGVERVVVESIVGTDEDQTAVAPGTLRRTWAEGGRRYFHYVTETPIENRYAVFSAAYALHEEEWTGSTQSVAIQVFHHPGHTQNLGRIVESAKASLSYFTAQFGPYPSRQLRFVEHPGRARGMSAESGTIDYREGFSLLNPRSDQDPDLPFAVVAHEVAHQWWGTQLAYARVEGAGVLSESLATYSSMRLVEHSFGRDHLRRYLRFMRLETGGPPSRAMPPLLRATDSFLLYRKGPFALHTLGEYIGHERVTEALRRLLEKHGGGRPPLPTTLDLYRELGAVTPDAFRPLLHDLFEANTYWDLEIEQAAAKQTDGGAWEVTLDVRARKVVIDVAGVETDVPMDDWIEIGMYAVGEQPPADVEVEQVGDPDEPFYGALHRIRSGRQTITLTMTREPATAAIDPDRLLIELMNTADNTQAVRTEG